MSAIQQSSVIALNGNRSKQTAAPPPIALTEDEFLERELRATRAALRAELRQMKASLGQAADVRLWTRHHPWTSVGVAATAGFAAAILIGKSRDTLRSVEADGSRAALEKPSALPPQRRSVFSGMLGTVLMSLCSMAEAVLRTLIITQLKDSLFTMQDGEPCETASDTPCADDLP